MKSGTPSTQSRRANVHLTSRDPIFLWRLPRVDVLRRLPPSKNYPHLSFFGNEKDPEGRPRRWQWRGECNGAGAEDSPRLPSAAYGDLAGTAGGRRHAIAGRKGRLFALESEEAGVGPWQLSSVAGGNAAAEPAARRHRRSRTRMQRWRFRCRSVARLAAKGHHGRCRGGGADGAEVWRSK